MAYDTRSENTLDQVRAGTHHEAQREVCSKGHPLDGIRRDRGREKRYCKQCNRDRRMANYQADPEGEKQKMRDQYRRRVAA